MQVVVKSSIDIPHPQNADACGGLIKDLHEHYFDASKYSDYVFVKTLVIDGTAGRRQPPQKSRDQEWSIDTLCRRPEDSDHCR